MKYVIIEDNTDIRQMFIELLKVVDSSFELVGEADSVSSGLKLLKEKKTDIAFLDVEIKEGLSFDILSQLKEIPFDVIFVTAFEKYAINAIQWNAFDYILKPLMSSKVVEVVNKIKSQKRIGVSPERVKSLAQKSKLERPDKILLRTQEEIVAVKLSDILYCSSDLNYTFFYFNSSKIIVSKPLKEYEDLLTEYGFFRIHKQHLINMSHFTKYLRADGGTVKLSNGVELPVSSRKKEQFLSQLSDNDKFL